MDGPSSVFAVKVTPFWRRRGINCESGTGVVRNFSPDDRVPVIESREMVAVFTVPSSTLSRKVEYSIGLPLCADDPAPDRLTNSASAIRMPTQINRLFIQGLPPPLGSGLCCLSLSFIGAGYLSSPTKALLGLWQ